MHGTVLVAVHPHPEWRARGPAGCCGRYGLRLLADNRIQAVALQARYLPMLIGSALAADMLGTRYEPLISWLPTMPQPWPWPRGRPGGSW